MHNSLFEFACDQLRELDHKAQREQPSMSDIQYADMLEHYKKSVLTNRAMEAEGYAHRYGRAYDDGMNDASMRGRYMQPWDNYGQDRRSYAGGFSDTLRRAMPMAPDEQTRAELERLAARMDRI